MRRQAAGLSRFALFAVGWLAMVGCGGGASGGDDELALHEVSPARITARGGDTLTIVGEGFRNGITVRLGETPITVLETTDATITALTPLQLAGTYDLTVTNPGGAEATLPQAVTVAPLDLEFREAAPHYVPDPGAVVITGVAAGDVDGDGDVDVLLAVAGGQTQLLLNSGTGEYRSAEVDPSEGPGLPPWEQDTRALALTDLDGDGDLDLFGCSGSGEPNRLFYNDGTGRFREVDALPARVGSCLQAAATDLDGDGLPELLVLAAKEGIDATRFLRIYRNTSTPATLQLTVDADIERPVALSGHPTGGTWAGGDPAHSATLSLSGDAPAGGASSGEAGYDFAGIDGYVLFYLMAPGVRFVPDELRLQLRGDGAGHRVTLRVRDASGERFTHEIGPATGTNWQAITAPDIASWDRFGGNDDGVVDLPLDRVTVQLDRVAGGPEQGALGLDDVVLWHASRGAALVEDFERVVPAHGWTDDVFSAITARDLDGDGAPEIALTASASATGEFLRVLRNEREVQPEVQPILRFSAEPVISPSRPVAHPALLDLEADGDADLLLLTVDQDLAFVNDGEAHFFDDSVSLLPVDRVDGRHAAVGDLDLDGLSDVVIANHGQANRLYLGAADGRLLDHTPTLGMDRTPSRWVVLLDADGDGVLDVLVVNDEAPRLQLYISVATGGP